MTEKLFKKKAQTNQKAQRQLVAALNPKSPIAEQYRTLRTNIQFSSVDRKMQAIMITSASPNAGKSMTAANLAVVYAQQGMRTLLIDADLRKPTTHYTFKLNNLRGLSTALIGEVDFQDAIQSSRIDHLDVLTSGPIPPNPAELLGSEKMKALLKAARDNYDMIIFDTPPALAVTDAKLLTEIVDGVLIIIRSGQTHYEAAEKTLEAFQNVNAKILGSVLNDVEKTDDNYYYYYSS